MSIPVKLFAVLCLSLLNGNNQVLTPCRVLQDLEQYRGKIVTLRGVVFMGYHGWMLLEANPQGCEFPRPSRVGWPARFAVEPSWSDFVVEEGVAAFTSDERSWEHLRKAVGASPIQMASGVYTGEIRVRPGVELIPGTSSFTNGYGHINGCPALFVLWKAKDVKPVRRGR